MRLVTTCNADGFERYAHRILETWHRWPVGTELWWYAEGFKLPNKPDGVVEISTLPKLDAFKARHKSFVPPNYLFDVVRFSHKVYAACDALADYTGVGVWLDADCVVRQDINPGYIEGHLRGDFMAMFKRRGMYTETGFWLMDCSHPEKAEFLETWQAWYDTGSFVNLPNWTDCETLDATVRRFEKAGRIKTGSLSGKHEKDMHPMARVELGRYIDHCKGARKDLGYSPEAESVQDGYYY